MTLLHRPLWRRPPQKCWRAGPKPLLIFAEGVDENHASFTASRKCGAIWSFRASQALLTGHPTAVQRASPSMDGSIFRFVLRFSKREQLFIILLNGRFISVSVFLAGPAEDASSTRRSGGGAAAFPVGFLGLGSASSSSSSLPVHALRHVPGAGLRQRRLQVLRQRLPRASSASGCCAGLRYELYSRVLRFRCRASSAPARARSSR